MELFGHLRAVREMQNKYLGKLQQIGKIISVYKQFIIKSNIYSLEVPVYGKFWGI